MADLTRRNAIGASVASVLMSRFGIQAADAAPKPDPVKMGPPPDMIPDRGVNRLSDIFASNQVTIMGDSDHRRGTETWSILDDPNVLKRMAAANVKTIALEIPRDEQQTFDALAAGKITRAQFATELAMNGYVPFFQSPSLIYEKLGNIVQSAAKHGIRIVCDDNIHTPEMDRFVGFANRHIAEPDLAGSNIFEALTNKYPVVMGSIVGGITNSRHSDRFNREIDKNLKPDLADGSHMVIMCGIEHAISLFSGFKKLGITSSVIAVHPDAAAIDTAKARYANAGELSISYDKLDNFNLRTRSFVASADGNGPAPEAPLQGRKPGMQR